MRKIITLLSTIFIVVGMLCAAPLTTEVHALTEEEVAWIEEARGALQEIVQEREIMALVYLSDTFPVREQASEDSNIIITVPSGQTVVIRDVVLDDDYRAWEYVSLYYEGTEYSGYIPRDNLACSDERFLEWEMNYGMNPAAMTISTFSMQEGAVASYPDIDQFPESYRPALIALKQQHPNWIFVAQNTQQDWNSVIAAQIGGGKSLVHKSLPDYCKEGLYDGGSWYFASKEILELYMDPRNALTEDAIFQFEQLTYNETYHTMEAVGAFLEQTFMNGATTAPGTVMSYSHIIWAVGAEDICLVSPFHLAARILQEQGQGTSPLISGTYPGYEGLYNYFNVGATGTSDQQVIESGLTYARNQGWTDAYAAIRGGAQVIAANYIKKGQDTLYLQKYNVGPGNHYPLHTHQYMQNISAPTSEAKSIKRLYEGAGSLNSPFVFKIPVYNNMPQTPCPMPTYSTNVVLQVPAGYDSSIVYLDGVPYATTARNGRAIATAPHGEAKSAVTFRYNENGVPVGMYVWTLGYQNGAYVVTPQPELENLLTYHGFSVRITGRSGIRYKTGISAELRGRLTTTGVDGFVLKEYGTLIMNNANRVAYPMIKGGEKVASGISYGVDANGAPVDKIFETVDGRYRYTAVLVGLPAIQYKTEFAFGGYAVLEKNGVQTVIYGPVRAQSIYVLAQEYLARGNYEVGSAPDVFLRQLIADADAVTAAQEAQAQASQP